MKKSRVLMNILTGFGGEFIVIILGLIIPRIFITNYGSDVNGLLSTITQIFTYMALLEAGIGQAAKNAFYKPISEGNETGISYIFSVALSYYRRLTIYYGLGVIILALILPFAINTQVSHINVFLIVIFEGLAGVVSFYFIQTHSILIGADGKNYVNNTINLVNKIATYVVRILMASFGMSIVFLQFSYFIISLIKVVVYKNYYNKHYSWLKTIPVTKTDKLKDRKSYIVTEIAWTVFSSTDLIVLSVFVSTQAASVYSVYNMIFASINVMLNAVYASVVYVLGYSYHEDIDKYIDIHDCFNSVFFGLMSMLMTVTYVLSIPFVKLYTAGVNDTNYIVRTLPIMFCLVQLLSWSRYVSGNLIGVAGRVKKAVKINVIEAVINVILSVALVRKFGIVGVLGATVIALPIKVIYCNYIGDNIILKRSSWKTVKILGGNFILFFLAVVVSEMFALEISTYFEFFIYGIILSFVAGIIFVLVNGFLNPKSVYLIKQILKRKRGM